MSQVDVVAEPPAIAVLIPEFPQQTHIAWWRVADAMRGHGARVFLMSTRRPDRGLRVHQALEVEAARTLYAWPPAPWPTMRAMLYDPGAVWRGLRYVAGLSQSTVAEKARLLPLIPAAVHLVVQCRRHGIDRVLVHSCGNAAHLLAVAHAMTGLRYGLRLGGDPVVYGKDHRHKMAAASFIVSAAPAYFEELVRDHGVAREKLVWTWVGTDLSRCTPAAGWPAPADRGRLRLITVARLNPTKGHLDVLDAIAHLRTEGVDVDYTIVGDGPFRQAIAARIAEHGLSDRVHLTGALDHADVVDALRRADVHVLASHGVGEAAPAAVCEAMACGVPVVSTLIGATGAMIDDGVTGFLVPQRDVTALAERLGRLARDPALLERMKRASHPASERFDVRQVARRIMGWFERVP